MDWTSARRRPLAPPRTHEEAFSSSPSEAMPPKRLEPKNNERDAGDCGPGHYAKRCERLIPARRERANCLTKFSSSMI
jgi:hypothetical protein